MKILLIVFLKNFIKKYYIKELTPSIFIAIYFHTTVSVKACYINYLNIKYINM